MKKNTLRIIIGIIISIIFIYLSFRNISFKKLSIVFKEMNNPLFYLSFLLTLFFTLLAMFFRGIRWKYLITFSNVNSLYLFIVENFGYFVNYILPGKIGEFAKSFVVSDDKKISFSSVFGTVVVERVLDLLFILSLGIFLPSYIINNIPAFNKIRIFSFILLAISLLLIIFLFLFKERFKMKEGKFFNFINKFTEGFYVFKKPINLILSILATAFVWFFTALSIFVLYKGMHINLPFFNSLITLYFFTLGITIPSSPGDIGPFHFFIIISLTAFGIEKEKALSYAIVYHFSQFFSVIPLGIFVTIKKGLKWR